MEAPHASSDAALIPGTGEAIGWFGGLGFPLYFGGGLPIAS